MKEFSFLNSYIKGETLMGGWGVIDTGLASLSAFLLVSYLKVFDYGVYLLVIAFFSLVSGLSIDLLQGVVFNDVARFIGEGEEARAKRLFLENTVFQLSIAFLLSAAVFMGAELVASWYGEDIASLIRIISPVFLISTLYTTMRMLFKVRLQFSIMATRSIVSKILRLAFLGSFILFASLNVKYALIAYVGSFLLSVLVCIPSFARAYAPWKHIKAAPEHILWRITKSYGKWSLFGESIKSNVLDVKPWLIKLFVNTEAVALYSVAESAYGVLKGFLPTDTLMVLFPRVVRDSQRTQKTLLSSIKYLVLVSIALGIIGAVAVPLLIRFLFPHYIDSIPLFLILLLALPFLAFRAPTAAFFVASRRQRFLFVRQIVIVITSLVLPLILLPLFGVVGMAIERVVTAAIMSAFIFWHLARHDIPLVAWREIFRFDKNDRALLLRLVRLLQSWFRKKMQKWR